MLRSLSLPLAFLSALHSISIYNLQLSPGDMTLTHNYITQATQDALKEQRRMRAGGRVSGGMANYGLRVE